MSDSDCDLKQYFDFFVKSAGTNFSVVLAHAKLIIVVHGFPVELTACEAADDEAQNGAGEA